MNKAIYILILLLIGLHFWGIVFFRPLYSQPVYFPILVGGWLLYGYKKWGRGNLKLFKNELRYWYWLIGGILMSSIPLIFIGQHPLYSLWIYRVILLTYLCYPVLLAIRPTRLDIINATYLYSILYVIVFFIVAANPALKSGTMTESGDFREISDTDFGYTLPGIEIMLFPLYAYISEYKKSPKKHTLYRIILILLILYFVQNRSVLFPAIVFTIWGLWNSSNSRLRATLIAIAILLFCVPALNPLHSLIEETQQQSNDADYNRNVAYVYYIKENFSSIGQFIFGTGRASAHLSNQIEQIKALQLLGIYSSDMGFLGFMNIYGIVPIIVFVVLLAKPLIRWRAFPTDIKLHAMHMLACSLTIAYFTDFIHTPWLILYLVLMSIDNNKDTIKR